MGGGVVYVAFDVVVAVGQGFAVAVEEVEVPGDEGDAAGPVQSVVGAVAPSACGDDVGQDSVGALFVAVVGHPFFVDGEAVVVVEGCFDGEVAVAGPSVFLALGAVGGVAHEVGEVGAVGGAAELGDESSKRGVSQPGCSRRAS